MIIQKIKNQVRKIPMATRLWNCIYRALEVNRKEIINWDVRESRKILESLRKIQKNEEKETLVTRQSESKEIQLSIIIPVYNVESFIDACIASIVNQKSSYKIESILVDDGSTDNSGKIIDKYADKYEWIRVYHQINQGVSSARNRGLENARGKYVMFLDADDVLTDDAVNILLNHIMSSDVDAVTGSYIFMRECGELGKKVMFENKITLNGDRNHFLNGFPWGTVFKRKIWENIVFPKGFFFEDTIMNYLVAQSCEKIERISFVTNKYRVNHNGITLKTKKTYKGLDTLWMVEYCLEECLKRKICLNMCLYEQTLRQFGNILYDRICILNEDEKKHCFVLCCYLLKKYFADMKENQHLENMYYQKLAIAFETNNYALWKLTSEMML